MKTIYGAKFIITDRRSGYQKRRLLRKIHRFLFITELKTKFMLRLFIYKLLIGLFNLEMKLTKKLKVKKIGDFIWEGKYER